MIPLYVVSGGVAIHPGEPQLTPTACNRDTQLRLLRRAIRVQHRVLVETLPTTVPAPHTWLQELPLLRYHVPLVLNANGAAHPGVPVRLDPVLGLVIGGEAIV